MHEIERMIRPAIIAGLLIVIACGEEKPSPGAGSAAGAAGSSVPDSKAPPTAEMLAKFDAACDGGTGRACFDAGMRRAQGLGTARDRVAAVSWLEKGCRLDDARSCGLLAGFLGVGSEGVAKDQKRAFELHQKACPRNPASCTVLVGYYFEGKVVPQDKAKAMAMLEMGCRAGDGKGCEDLANRLEKGNGIAMDKARAVETARKACDLDPMYCETLGAFYIGGTGVAKDSARGESLVEKACNGGSKQACKGLRILRGE
jgi:uncharacterized protein